MGRKHKHEDGEGKKKGGKLKKLFFLSALAGIGAAIFKKKSQSSDAGWEEAKPPAEGA